MLNYSNIGKTIRGIDNYSELCKASQSCKTIHRFLMLPETIHRVLIQSIKTVCESIQGFVTIMSLCNNSEHCETILIIVKQF